MMAMVDYENKCDPRFDAEAAVLRMQGAALGVPKAEQQARKIKLEDYAAASCKTASCKIERAPSERQMAKMTSMELCKAVDYLIADIKDYFRINKLPYPGDNWAHRRAVAAAQAVRKMWSE
jgi:hypothetical protein